MGTNFADDTTHLRCYCANDLSIRRYQRWSYVAFVYPRELHSPTDFIIIKEISYHGGVSIGLRLIPRRH